MNVVRKQLDNQAIGVLPLLLFLFLNNYFSYLLSFVVGASCCVGCFALFRLLREKGVYQFLLLPVAATFVLYSIFLFLKVEPTLFLYSPLVAELLFVVMLTLCGFTRHSALRWARDSKWPVYRRIAVRSALNESYFLAQLLQGLYTLHLFAILFYAILPESVRSMRVERFLNWELGWMIGVLVFFYEQVRLWLMNGNLQKEMWLPVLGDQGKVIGCIARSVSRSLPKKYCHPIVRVAVVFNGMIYLARRPREEYVSPDTIDHPMHSYVLFRHSVASTLKETVGSLARDKSLPLRLLIRYTFENEKVKHFVSLYIIRLRTEEQLARCERRDGKLWTPKQIEENLSSGIFSEYFVQEFPLLRNTVLATAFPPPPNP